MLKKEINFQVFLFLCFCLVPQDCFSAWFPYLFGGTDKFCKFVRLALWDNFLNPLAQMIIGFNYISAIRPFEWFLITIELRQGNKFEIFVCRMLH